VSLLLVGKCYNVFREQAAVLQTGKKNHRYRSDIGSGTDPKNDQPNGKVARSAENRKKRIKICQR